MTLTTGDKAGDTATRRTKVCGRPPTVVSVVPMTQTTVAANVRAELARHRISQTAVAKHLGVSRQNVAQRLNGTVDFRVGELITIASLLNIDPSAFLVDAA